MSDLQDFTQKNRRHTGASGIKVSNDGLSDGDRVNEKGRIRFNDSTDLMEYYNGSEWKPIDSPPVITTIAVDGGTAATTATIDNEASGTFSLAVNGSLFDTTGATVTLEGTGETLSANSITRNSGNLLTAIFTNSAVDVSNSPYTVKVTNGSGLSAELASAVSADTTAPTFTNAADTNANIFDGQRSSVTIAAADLVGASNASAYAVSSGSLPSGLSLNTTTGVISGNTSAVGTDTVTTFSITATGDDATATRQFTITQKAPVATSYTSSSNFVVPTGISAVDVLVVAGGGAGGSGHSGGGGAGGLIFRPGFPVTPGATIPLTVGGGGPQGPGGGNQPGSSGNDSVFSNLTAKGGGAGHSDADGIAGGSGAGGSCYRENSQADGGAATQPNQPGESGNYGFGNAGGDGAYDGDPNHGAQGGAGGGAGGSGGNGGKNSNGTGGVGKAYSISGSSVHYAGGGGSGCHQNVSQSGAGGNGGGGGSIPDGAGTGHPNAPGVANRGGGGGGGSDGSGGNGGSGVIIVSY